MAEAEWGDGNMRCFGMLLDGRAQATGIRQRGHDATLLIVFNAYHDVVKFTLPEAPGGGAVVAAARHQHAGAARRHAVRLRPRLRSHRALAAGARADLSANPAILPPAVSRRPRASAMLALVIVVAVLYLAREVLIPLALAILFSFVLAPGVRRLERWHLGRVASTFIVVIAGVAVLGAVGALAANQAISLAAKLPEYRAEHYAEDPRDTRAGLGRPRQGRRGAEGPGERSRAGAAAARRQGNARLAVRGVRRLYRADRGAVRAPRSRSSSSPCSCCSTATTCASA